MKIIEIILDVGFVLFFCVMLAQAFVSWLFGRKSWLKESMERLE